MGRTSISEFNKFIKTKEVKIDTNNSVVVYSRVSSKQQLETNGSIEYQIKQIHKFCSDEKYEIIQTFGEKNESAKSDLRRKEFKKMMDYIKKLRRKPLGIVVYDVNRFSRTGGSAISILQDLQIMGVHLFEVSSGLNTQDPRDLYVIQQKLLDSRKENMDRINLIVPRIKDKMKEGLWFGVAPIGYDHYGPRVKNERFYQKTQKIVINNDGRILKEGFMLKLTDHHSDVEISKILLTKGLKIDRKKLGTIWKNPFYCGINTNKMLEEAVEGNWEKIISKKDFLRLQIVLQENHSGYKHSKKNDFTPLTRFIRCKFCGKNLSGYLSKGLPYYKCNSCKVNLNGNTSSKNIGANDLFKNLLNQFKVNPQFIELVELQLNKVMGFYNVMESTRENEIIGQIDEIQTKIDTMEFNLATGVISRDMFDKHSSKLKSEITNKSIELNKLSPTLSNQGEMIKNVVKNMGNIANIWDLSVIEDKQRLQETLFPGGVYYDKEKHDYLTKNINNFMLVSSSISTSYEDKKNEDKPNNYDLSSTVVRTLQISNSILRDLHQLYTVFDEILV
jgi:DNA invertase Pin-like site-specific DNA recombinase